MFNNALLDLSRLWALIFPQWNSACTLQLPQRRIWPFNHLGLLITLGVLLAQQIFWTTGISCGIPSCEAMDVWAASPLPHRSEHSRERTLLMRQSHWAVGEGGGATTASGPEPGILSQGPKFTSTQREKLPSTNIYIGSL